MCITFGLAGYFSPLREDTRLDTLLFPSLGVYSEVLDLAGIGIGGGVLLIVIFIPPMRQSGNLPGKALRILFFLMVSLPLFSDYLTVTPAFCFFFVGALFAVSAKVGEQGSVEVLSIYGPKLGCLPLPRSFHDLKVGLCRFFHRWFRRQPIISALNRGLVFTLWGGVNFGLFWGNYELMKKRLDTIPSPIACYPNGAAGDEALCADILVHTKVYLPFAKGFGMMLNFNIGLVFFLVTRSLVLKVAGMSQSRRWNRIFALVSQNVLLHKLVAIAIFLATCGHVTAHIMASSHALPILDRVIPGASLVNAEGDMYVYYSVYGTGALLCFVLVLLYGVSVEPVRNHGYRSFLSIHIACSVLLYGLLWWHATAFVHWGLLPFSMYIMDAQFRCADSSVPTKLLRVVCDDHVLQLVFSVPWSWKSGMYAWLQSPCVYRDEWHPFSISSATDADELTFHIKVCPEGWTEQLQQLLLEVVEAQATEGKPPEGWGRCYEFLTTNWFTGSVVQGIFRHHGKPIFLIDGPHSTPQVRFMQYETIVLVGGDTGLGAMHSILEQLARYRWQKDVRGTLNVYLIWICRNDHLGESLWFANALSNTEVALGAAELKSSLFHFEAHVFVMGSASSTASSAQNVGAEQVMFNKCSDMQGVKITRPFTGKLLLDVMRSVNVHSIDFLRRMTNVASRNSLSLRRSFPSKEAGPIHPVVPDDSDTPPTESNSAPENGAPPDALDPTRNVMGHTHVWRGRPQWDDVFAYVAKRHQKPSYKSGERRVGVFFCGGVVMLNDVQDAARRRSNKLFKFEVHKDTF